jgi:hypothetical protein
MIYTIKLEADQYEHSHFRETIVDLGGEIVAEASSEKNRGINLNTDDPDEVNLMKLNATLGGLESEAHNARGVVLDAQRIVNELEDGDLPDEEREVMEEDLKQKMENVQYMLQEIQNLADNVKPQE